MASRSHSDTLGLRIRKLRKRNKWSLSQAVAVIGCSKAQLSKLECGTSDNPTLKILVAICVAYNIQLGRLLKGLVP